MRRSLRRIGPLALTLATAATGQAQVFSNTTPITIADPTTVGTADPYPSTLVVSGMTGTITDIDVQVVGFRHTFPDDVDILLVGPTGAATLLISDVGGGTDIGGINVALDDEAAGTIPDGGPITAGSFRPTNVDTTSDAFPAPAPAPPATVALTTFDGTDPNGTWSLFVIDDTGADVGRLDGGFQMLITTDTTPATLFTASTPVRIHDRWGFGTPNPSDIVVSGAPNTIVSMTVTLNNIAHTNPDDLDILLVGPTGATFIMASDAGGTTDVTDATITLDDAAATVLPDTTVLTTGSFQPRNYGTGDNFRVPALPPYNSAATAGTSTFTSVFAGTDPNGTWSLYIADDVAANTGSIAGGWSISFVLTPVELMNFAVE